MGLKQTNGMEWNGMDWIIHYLEYSQLDKVSNQFFYIGELHRLSNRCQYLVQFSLLHDEGVLYRIIYIYKGSSQIPGTAKANDECTNGLIGQHFF